MAYTTIDDPSAFFHTQLYAGAGANQDVVNDAYSGDFKPDFLWIKNRTNGSYGPHYYDSTRGAKKGFYSDAGYGDDAEFTDGEKAQYKVLIPMVLEVVRQRMFMLSIG